MTPNSNKEKIDEKSKYFVKVSLTSARKLDGKNVSKEYYFEVGKKRKQRTPTRGYFEFSFDKMTDLKEPITLFTELVDLKKNEEVEVMLEFKEKNKSQLKLDETISRLKLSIRVGEKRNVYTLNDENLEIRVHLMINQTDL